MFARALKTLLGRESWRQAAVAVLALGAIFAFGLFMTGQFVVAKRQADSAGRREVYTGSILYTPDEGRTCHQMLFDNHTGKFTDNGAVDCDKAAYRGLGGTTAEPSSNRLNIISESFRGH